jgi:hypothetical protein
MQAANLPPHIQAFVADLLRRGFDVWLIGSRANPTNEQPNDWDFVVFGSAKLLEQLRSAKPIPDLDLLIVVDGENFEGPWPRATDGVIKHGSLTTWKWTQTGSDSATYKGTKLPDDWGSPKSAIRVSS